MSNSLNNGDIWYIIKSLLTEKNGSYLVKHHLDSYNDFIENKIPSIITQANPLSIYHEYDMETNTYKFEIIIIFKNVTICKPNIVENDGSSKLMYPKEARLRNLSYCSALHVDLDINIWIDPMTENKKLLCQKEIKMVLWKVKQIRLS